MRTALLPIAAAALTAAIPAAAQDHSQHGAPPPPAQAPPRVEPAGPAAPKPEVPAPAADPHAGHDMSGEQAPAADTPDPHAGHDMATGTALPAGNAPAPAPPTDHYADRVFPPDEMARARKQMKREHGGTTTSQLIFNIAEFQPQRGRDGYRWDGEFWLGGDTDRLTLKTEGEGTFGERLEGGEVQALYSRALDPYWNLQAGVRQDFGRGPSRSYVTVGVEGLAPYWFEVEGALFLSDKGDLLGRAEAYYDQRITQRLILQPRAELNFSVQDVPESRIGPGLSNVELGLRLRYEISREFAPYFGISYERKAGRTARYARIGGEEAESADVVVGVRFWF